MIIKRIKELPYTQENIDKYKSKDNMLKHARYTKGVSSGIFLTKSGELVGYIGWEGEEIICLEVTKKYRGQGFAKYMLEKAIKSGCKTLHVTSSNTPAISLYRSLGFKEVERIGNRIKMVLN